jgi:hypothetical protein
MKKKILLVALVLVAMLPQSLVAGLADGSNDKSSDD